ncbi:uncharacterized protein [Clytia hemisphaerica]|uniref:uncharacterized protein n=1 Tax=Clytia hemisphaerica TaxID=252671 RepID=UPI0034D6CAFB
MVKYKKKRKKSEKDDDPDFVPSQSIASSSKSRKHKENDRNSSNVQQICVIHCTDSCEELVTLTKLDTWLKLKEAATLRKHPLMETKSDSPSEIPANILYHRKCYQRFIMKREIDKLKLKHEMIQAQVGDIEKYTDGIEETERRAKRVCSDSPILKDECIFCKKRKTKNREEENLVQCIDERGRDQILEWAKKKGNFDVLGISNLITNEAKYHKSCYQSFIKVPDGKGEDKTEIEAEAFKAVIKYCLEQESFHSSEIVTLNFLMSIMEGKLKDNDLTMEASTKKNFKRSLETKMPSLKFLKTRNETYVYHQSVSLDEIVLKYVNATEENDQLKNEWKNEEVQAIKTFDFIRKEIRNLTDTIPWPPQPQDLTPDKVVIPPMLNLLLSTLLKGKDGTLSEKAERLKMSIAQDLIYAVTKGRVKTPKSILLSQALLKR